MRPLIPLVPLLLAGCAASADPELQQANPASELDGPDGCSDGVDNDGDGQVDCADPDCQTECDADNLPPEISALAIEPAEPDTRDALRCVPEASDAEGDPIAFDFAWVRDGVVEATGEELPAGATWGYDAWTCQATPTDGVDDGVVARATVEVRADDTCTSARFELTGRVVVPRASGQGLVDTPFTVEAWVRVDPLGSTTLPVVASDPQDDGSGWRLAVVGEPGSRRLRWQVGGGVPGVPQLDSIRDVPEGQWTHLAVTWDGAGLGLWIDGIPSGQGVLYTPVDGSSAGDLSVGGMLPGGEVHQFLGHIDEVRLSDVARYGAEFTPRTWYEPDADTLALLHLDEGAGSDTMEEVAGAMGLLDGVGWDGQRSACEAY